MAVTSANQSGQPPATTIDEPPPSSATRSAVYLDGGTRADNVPSTIVDCTGERPRVLREGALSEADLATVLDAHFPPEPVVAETGESSRANQPLRANQ